MRRPDPPTGTELEIFLLLEDVSGSALGKKPLKFSPVKAAYQYRHSPLLPVWSLPCLYHSFVFDAGIVPACPEVFLIPAYPPAPENGLLI
ncbi:MAG: hypothetical protein ACLS5R_07145 [Blautia sp.]